MALEIAKRRLRSDGDTAGSVRSERVPGPNHSTAQGAICGTSQVDDDFDPAGLDRHHFKRHRTSGLDAYPAFSHACGHQAIGYVLRPRLGKNVIEFD
jgi:hypothetical protein